MGTIEAKRGGHDRMAIESRLTHHWMLDGVAAGELAHGISEEGCDHIDSLLSGVESRPEAILARDEYRREITAIYSGESDKKLIVIGPCSLDAETDYEELFGYIQELQEDHPESLIAIRANGSKPRTKGGWGGLFRSTEASDQEKVIAIYQEAFERTIPILTEITDKDEFGALAPYLSGAWLGARDMQSTSLHSLFMATRLPVAIKNGTDGKAETVRNAITAIGLNTEKSDGSGVNLGVIAHTYRPNSVGLPAMLKVGQGNKNVAIIARGYELPKDMPKEERSKKAFQHLGELCALAAEVECVVLLDGGHGVPPMFDIEKTDGDRFQRVVKKFQAAIRRGEIPHADRLRGYVSEISTTHGKTDKNWLVSEASQPDGLSEIIREPMAVR